MKHRDIVVVGASAGGVDALMRMARALPAPLPAAICIVLHVGALPSRLAQLLEAAGHHPAHQAEDGEALERGTIHVAPPDRHLLLQDGRLRLGHGPKEHHTRPAIDPLFRSAAIDAGARVIGVVLTGRLGDGAAGLQAIRACGGLALVQDPSDAEVPDMPRAVLRATEVDHCEPLDQLIATIGRLAGTPVRPAHADVSDFLHAEQRIALGADDPMDDLRRIGAPSTFMCPECRGTLWEIDDAKSPRFRCHTGHGYSMESLLTLQGADAEAALRSGVRALQDRVYLLRRIAAVDRDAGDPAHAERAEAEATHLMRQITVLRRLADDPGPAGQRDA
jgi:two-component system chemotaxis response regulator CheB